MIDCTGYHLNMAFILDECDGRGLRPLPHSSYCEPSRKRRSGPLVTLTLHNHQSPGALFSLSGADIDTISLREFKDTLVIQDSGRDIQCFCLRRCSLGIVVIAARVVLRLLLENETETCCRGPVAEEMEALEVPQGTLEPLKRMWMNKTARTAEIERRKYRNGKLEGMEKTEMEIEMEIMDSAFDKVETLKREPLVFEASIWP
ncbi:hypothetical protein Tco_0172539 [Tanacetum coccineum]